MKKMLFLLVVPIGLACSGGTIEKDEGATPEILPDTVTEVIDASGELFIKPADVRPELPTETIPEIGELIADDVPLVQCDPGEGCFMDQCQDNTDCQSGWCVEHMGEGVCTSVCQEECPIGWICKEVGSGGPDVTFICISAFATLCKPCATSEGCQGPGGSQGTCLDYGQAGSFCGGACDESTACPDGYACQEIMSVEGVAADHCVATAGECECTDKSVALGLLAPCQVANDQGTCNGKRVCTEDGLSECDAGVPALETCNGQDDDCDDEIDEALLVEGEPVNLCNDDNPCTKDMCKGDDGCKYQNLDGDECVDGDSCTVGDHCTDGLCMGQPLICDDEDPCTDDQCDGLGTCEFQPNQVPCDDEDPCTVGDLCGEGECGGTPVSCDCQTNDDCLALEDGDMCNGTLFCDLEVFPYNCAVELATVVECPLPPDGPDAVCLAPSCDAATGDCSLVSAHEGFACDDANACLIGDLCQDGACVAQTQLNCADDNPCTDDSCDPDLGCLHVDNQAACNDGDVCTTGDACDAGICLGGPALVCDDNDICNGIETCDSAAGCISGLLLGCDDADPCNGLETCHPLDGCLPGEALACNDGNVCTDDSCDEGVGCLFESNQEFCDDGNACTQGDHCQGGTCTFGEMVSCADDDVCTDTWCDPTQGCVTILNSAPCDDDDICTSGDHCHLGECLSGNAIVCNDNNLCTDDSCQPGAGCSFVPNLESCSDGNECTVDDQCAGGWCVPGNPLSCDDQDVCTDDSCQPEIGCVFELNSAPCDDANACTEDDVCGAGVCAGPTLVDCDDVNVCTEDSCDLESGCNNDVLPDETPCGISPSWQCHDGECICIKDCQGKECGPDGCGGLCGMCFNGVMCDNGVCPCQGNCDGFVLPGGTFGYYRRLVVNHQLVAVDLVDFPVLVSLSNDVGLAGHAAADGSDVVFAVLDPDAGATLLTHEVEYCANGSLDAWVKVDLAADVDTVLYMFYGSENAGGGQDSTDVWSGYQAVWHLAETQGQIEDSTINEHTGTPHNVHQDAAGKIDGADYFDGNGDYHSFGDWDVPSWESYSVSVWFLQDGQGNASNGYGQKIIDKTTMYSDYYLSVRTATDGHLAFQTYSGGGAGIADKTHDYRDNKWHYAVVNRQGGNGELWVDGELKGTSDSLKTVANGQPLLLGYSVSPDSYQKKYFSGRLDEVRIADAPRTKGWIVTEYNNQAEPGAFILMGDEVSARECGDNGCDGECGTCDGLLESCVVGICHCHPDCAGKECGEDGCSGLCGSCEPPLACENDKCVMPPAAWVDQFDDNAVNENLWDVSGIKWGSMGGFHFEEAGGTLTLNATVGTTGNTYGGTAWAHAKTDLKTGGDQMVVFNWSYSKQAASLNCGIIEIANGPVSVNQGGLFDHNIHTETPGRKFLNYQTENLGFQTWSICTDAGAQTASIYIDEACEGDALKTVDISGLDKWYLRYLVCTATSAGFPANNVTMKLDSIKVF